MSELKFCQGTDCQTYHTKDRLRGTKGSKTYQTRRRSRLNCGEFCDTKCQYDWFRKYGTRAVDHFGRTTEPKHLTEQNAWVKRYDWDSSYQNRFYVYCNSITNEQRPLTEEQFNDTNYTLNINTGE